MDSKTSASSKAPRILTAPELLRLELPESKQIIPGILNEGATLISARPKKGKTFFALGCALAIASGGLGLGKIEVEQGDALYLCLEDGPRRLRDRLRAMLAGSDAPERLILATAWPRLDDGGHSGSEKGNCLAVGSINSTADGIAAAVDALSPLRLGFLWATDIREGSIVRWHGKPGQTS
jgi:hypothetical protein